MELSPIKAIELAAARTEGAVSLAQGIPSFNTPEIIRNYVIEQIKVGACDKYSLTSGLPELREEISSNLKSFDLKYDPDSEIIVTAGSIEGITASILASTKPGDEVIIPSPSYASYAGAIRLARCEPRFVSLDEDKNFDFDVEKIASAINQKTSAILICNPNNPTGTVYSKKSLIRLLELSHKHNLTLITDEVYDQFYYINHPHLSPAQLPGGREQVIRVCSFSKSYAMTGWRVGFVHGAKEKVSSILKYHDAMVTCAPVVSQYAAIAALRYGAEHVQSFRDEFKRRRDFVLSKLDSLSSFLDYQTPKAAYFVFPRIKDSVPDARDSVKFAYDLLARGKLAVVPGKAFGPSGEGHIRISYGREWKDLEEGMERLKNFLETRSSHVTKNVPHTNGKPLTWKNYLLRGLAHFFIARHSFKIIGIAGTRGKTTAKRHILSKLSPTREIRSSILSHNTSYGLPLSIIGISPLNFKSKLQFYVSLFKRSLLGFDNSKYLILEYGAETLPEANWLLSIVKPNYLVVMPTENKHRLAVETLRKQVSKDKCIEPEMLFENYKDRLDKGLLGESEQLAEIAVFELEKLLNS